MNTNDRDTINTYIIYGNIPTNDDIKDISQHFGLPLSGHMI